MIAEFVCGPAGCGKTTYCEGRRQFIEATNEQRVVINVNLDPANEGVFPYPCDVDVREIVSHHVVAHSENLGPNGSYLFCAEYLATRVDDLVAAITEAVSLKSHGKMPHLIIDAPGQVEFYLQTDCVHRILHALEKKVGCSLCIVHLHDAVVATRSLDTYISACLLALTFMTNFELPQVNFLSKWDCVGDEALDFLSVGSIVDNLPMLCRRNPMAQRNSEFAKALLSIVEGYSIVGFHSLAVEDPDSMSAAAQLTDTIFGVQ